MNDNDKLDMNKEMGEKRSRKPFLIRDPERGIEYHWLSTHPVRNDSASYNVDSQQLVVAGVTVQEHPVFTSAKKFENFVRKYLADGKDGWNSREELEKVQDLEQLVDFINNNNKIWMDIVPPFVHEKGWDKNLKDEDEFCRVGDSYVVFVHKGKAKLLVDNDRMNIVRKMKRRMRLMGFSPLELGVRSGVSEQNIFKFLAGTYNPSLDILEKIAAVLEMKVDLVELKKKR